MDTENKNCSNSVIANIKVEANSAVGSNTGIASQNVYPLTTSTSIIKKESDSVIDAATTKTTIDVAAKRRNSNKRSTRASRKSSAGSKVIKKARPYLLKKHFSSNNKDKPKRGLSAYNIFFKYTRSRIIDGLDKDDDDNDNDNSTVEEIVKSIKEIVSTCQVRKPPNSRKYRNTHNQISFSDLAKRIATKWKTIDSERKKLFEKYASLDQERYHREMKSWKQDNENNKTTSKKNNGKSTTTLTANPITTSSTTKKIKTTKNFPTIVSDGSLTAIQQAAKPQNSNNNNNGFSSSSFAGTVKHPSVKQEKQHNDAFPYNNTNNKIENNPFLNNNNNAICFRGNERPSLPSFVQPNSVDTTTTTNGVTCNNTYYTTAPLPPIIHVENGMNNTPVFNKTKSSSFSSEMMNNCGTTPTPNNNNNSVIRRVSTTDCMSSMTLVGNELFMPPQVTGNNGGSAQSIPFVRDDVFRPIPIVADESIRFVRNGFNQSHVVTDYESTDDEQEGSKTQVFGKDVSLTPPPTFVNDPFIRENVAVPVLPQSTTTTDLDAYMGFGIGDDSLISQYCGVDEV